MNCKLIVTDIDGTLLNNKHEIPEGNIKALKRASEMGIPVVLCSGRSKFSINKIEEKLGINKINNFGAAYHGSTIYKVDTDEIIKKYRIEKQLLKEVLELLKDENFSYLIHDDEMLYTFVETEYTNDYAVRCKDICHTTTFEELNDTISKFIIIGEHKKLREFEKSIPVEISERCNHFFASEFLYEFINKDASKGNALKHLCEILGIDQKDTIGFGDNFNDLALIKEAGLGVAVANAVPELKEIADYVTVRDNREGAIEEVLNKFVFKENE